MTHNPPPDDLVDFDPKVLEVMTDLIRQVNRRPANGQGIKWFIMDGVMFHVDRGPCDCDGVPLPETEANYAVERLAERLGLRRYGKTQRVLEFPDIKLPTICDGGDDGKWKPPGGYPGGKGRR